jgi:hypothetical protein
MIHSNREIDNCFWCSEWNIVSEACDHLSSFDAIFPPHHECRQVMFSLQRFKEFCLFLSEFQCTLLGLSWIRVLAPKFVDDFLFVRKENSSTDKCPVNDLFLWRKQCGQRMYSIWDSLAKEFLRYSHDYNWLSIVYQVSVIVSDNREKLHAWKLRGKMSHNIL